MVSTGPEAEDVFLLHGVYIIDADNTLWDTNEVFLGAQIRMIENMRENGCSLETGAALEFLRALDFRLAVALDDFEYDYSRLACALFLVDRGRPENEAVRLATAAVPPAPEWDRARLAGRVFYTHLQAHCPPLFFGVAETLAALRSGGNTLVLHSEGRHERIAETLSAHNLDPFFHHTALERKSQDSFRRARLAGEAYFAQTKGRSPDHCVVVGDSPKRDIRFGNIIGATTVFKPGGWLGTELPDDPLLTPDYTISCFTELLELGTK